MTKENLVISISPNIMTTIAPSFENGGFLHSFELVHPLLSNSLNPIWMGHKSPTVGVKQNPFQLIRIN